MNKIQSVRELAYPVYLDKVLGAWIGKSIGGIVGAPFEAHKIRGDMTADTIWPATIWPNDDLDIQVLWLELMEERGCFFSPQDMIELWQDRCWYNFAEYGTFLNNVQRGIPPPLSGGFNNEFFSESMGCPIRAEIWGLVCPGNPLLAATLARMDGELDHIRESVWAEQFWAAATAEAFFTDRIEVALEAGRQAVPEKSHIRHLSAWVPELWARHGTWRRVWMELIRQYGDRDSSKGPLDFGFILLALAAGGGNMKETLTLCVNCGWDVDCTAATAGALLGTLQGALRLPPDWRQKAGENLSCDINVKHKTAPLTQFAADTCAVGLEMCECRNPDTALTAVPEPVRAAVVQRLASRPPPPGLDLSVHYGTEPVLPAEGVAEATLRVANRSKETQSGELRFSAPGRLSVSPGTVGTLSIPPGTSQSVTLAIRRAAGEPVAWDKNLIRAEWAPAAPGPATAMTFGLAGARRWTVYGPYWDGWDTRKSAVCPFRNEKLIDHPCRVPESGPVMSRNFVDLGREYLDEKRLVSGPVPGEWPFVVERGEDWIDAADLGGFKGEAVYYFVRALVAEKPVRCTLCIGCTSPLAVWVEGLEAFRSETTQTWALNTYSLPIALDARPRRLAIKTARITDEFRLSLCFIKENIPGDKTVGDSYMLDCTGDNLIEG